MVTRWGHTGPDGARRVKHEIDSFSYKNENCQRGSDGVIGDQRELKGARGGKRGSEGVRGGQRGPEGARGGQRGGDSNDHMSRSWNGPDGVILCGV